MSTRRVSVALLIVAALSLQLLVNGQEVLNNDAIVKMVKVGLSEAVIIDKVKGTASHFDVTSDKLVELKKAGVSSTVLQAMIAAAKGSPAPAAKMNDSTRQATARWQVHESRDKLTQELRSIEADKKFPAEQEGHFEVTASCGRDTTIDRIANKMNPGEIMKKLGLPVKDEPASTIGAQHLDNRYLAFRFRYVPEGSARAIKLSPLAQTVTQGDIFTNPSVNPPKSCAFLRVLVDDHGNGSVESNVCDRPNFAAISFVNIHGRDLAGVFMPGNNPLSEPFRNMFRTMMDTKDESFATMNEVFKSDKVLVELPFSDGDSSVVRIEPQDPAFKKFAEKCLEAFPDAAPLSPARAATVQTADVPTVQIPDVPTKRIVDSPVSNRTYIGSSRNFENALPDYIQKAAIATGTDPTHYQKETALLQEVVRTCSQITPEAARKVTKYNSEFISSLGIPYRNCESGIHLATEKQSPASEVERKIVFFISPVGKKWVDGRGYTIRVQFVPLRTDEQANPMSFDVYGIVEATLGTSN
jgi:hypothetical protein